MKKYLLSILALVGLFATSCSNDDIVVEQNTILEYNINVSNMYNTFDMVDDMTNALRDKKQCVTVTTLVYDKNGLLVDEKISTEFALNNLKETFNLDHGSYTIISVQSVGNPSKGGDFIKWELIDKEKLATVSIKHKSIITYYTNAIGVCTTNLTVDKSTSVTVSPEAIGSLVHVYYCNFDKSDCVNLGFYTRDVTEKYSLNPSLSRDERFVVDLSAKNVMNIRDKRENQNLDIDHCTLYMLENNIEYCVCDQTAEEAGTSTWLNWPSNEATANLEDGKTYYTAAYFKNKDVAFKTFWGSSFSEFHTWYNQCITSSDTENDNKLIPDTYQSWGGSVASVQTFMKGYEMIMGSDGYAAPSTNNAYELQYRGKGKEALISYSFASATTGLTEVDILYNSSEVATVTLKDILDSNYLFLVESEGIYMYATSDYETCVLLFTLGNYLYVGYVDASMISNAKTRSIANYKDFLNKYITSKKKL